jgi:dTDP-4-amino-4,6-dideoxygalactose transaminase
MIPLNKPYFDWQEIAEVKKVFDSGWVSQGPKCEEFEKAVAKYLGCDHVISVSNCTAALYIALLALDICPLKEISETAEPCEVIAPDYTFPATIQAIQFAGAKPVLVDVDLDGNLDPDEIEPAITSNTKAIMVVHQFGLPAKMGKIMRIANKHGLPVIEDAACALGAEYKGRKVGTIGAVGCFSLHAKKGITTGEGGLICTNSGGDASFIREFSNFGVERTYGRKVAPVFEMSGAFNFKMSDIAAAIGLVQLTRIDEFIEERLDIARQWVHVILKDRWLQGKLNGPWISSKSTFQTITAQCRDPKQREMIRQYFRDRGFETGCGTFACHQHPAFDMFANRSLEISKLLSESSISLPVWHGLNVEKEWEASNGSAQRR